MSDNNVTIAMGAISIDPKVGTPFSFVFGFDLAGIALAILVAIVLNQFLAVGQRRQAAQAQEPAAGAADGEPEISGAEGAPAV